MLAGGWGRGSGRLCWMYQLTRPPLTLLPQMLAYLAGVLVPATDDFVYLIAGSCCAVAAAAALYTAFALHVSCGRNLDVAPAVV